MDFSTLLPGPYATLILADLGAEVLKVSGRGRRDTLAEWPPMVPGTELPAGRAWLGRNKKSIYLDLKKPQAVEAVKKLVLDYDVVVEQFRPGVMSRLGLGYEQLKEVNPRLIYCSITGYGQTGPMAHRAGHDINYLARTGLLGASGRKATGPAPIGFQAASVSGGSLNAVMSILAAIIYRDRTGEGQLIDVSLHESAVPFHALDAAGYLAGGPLPEREGSPLNGGSVYDYYETADGEYMSVGSLEPKFFAALCQGLGFPEWSDGKILEENVQEAKESFRARFKTKTRAEWTEIFNTLDACVEPVMNLGDAVADPHLRARGMWPEVEVPGTDGATMTQLGCPIHLSACPTAYRHAGYPEGWHTEEILSALGYDQEQIRDMI